MHESGLTHGSFNSKCVHVVDNGKVKLSINNGNWRVCCCKVFCFDFVFFWPFDVNYLHCRSAYDVVHFSKRSSEFGTPFDVLFTAPEVLEHCSAQQPYVPLSSFNTATTSSSASAERSASDVWSVGCVLYHLSAHRLPFVDAKSVPNDAAVEPFVSLVRSKDPRAALPLPIAQPLVIRKTKEEEIMFVFEYVLFLFYFVAFAWSDLRLHQSTRKQEAIA